MLSDERFAHVGGAQVTAARLGLLEDGEAFREASIKAASFGEIGYRLARPAVEITLLDFVKVFENSEDRVMCPFGKNWCGNGEAGTHPSG